MMRKKELLNFLAIAVKLFKVAYSVLTLCSLLKLYTLMLCSSDACSNVSQWNLFKRRSSFPVAKNYFFEVPITILADMDPAFRSNLFKEFCTAYCIQLESTLAYVHTEVGLVERAIQALKRWLMANLESISELWEIRFGAHNEKTNTV